MPLYYSSLGLVVLSNIVYHILQKTMPSGSSPMAVLFITYLTAAAVTLGGLLLSPADGGLAAAFAGVDWRSALLGLAVVGLELGFFLAYQAGWSVSTCALIANTGVAIALLVVGALFFKEHLNAAKLAGVALCMIGLLLVNKG